MPPTTARDSTTATRFFIFEAATAARCPEGLEPITIRSYLAALMRVSPVFSRRVEVYQAPQRDISDSSTAMMSAGNSLRLRFSQLAPAFFNETENAMGASCKVR